MEIFIGFSTSSFKGSDGSDKNVIGGISNVSVNAEHGFTDRAYQLAEIAEKAVQEQLDKWAK